MQNFEQKIPAELERIWGKPSSEEMIEETVDALKAKSFEAYVVDTREEAARLVFSLIPEGSDVWDNTSITLLESGISQYIRDSGKYNSLRKKVFSINDPKERLAARRATATAKYAVGSANALVKDGTIMIASMTGSQIPYYAYSSENVIFVIGSQKIVRSFEEGLKRIEEYVVPLEDARMKSEGAKGTSFNKLLVIRGESIPGRIRVIITRERLGF
ncbi:MAG: LUD domain-containing protein [Conexivisphaerales archaeon]